MLRGRSLGQGFPLSGAIEDAVKFVQGLLVCQAIRGRMFLQDAHGSIYDLLKLFGGYGHLVLYAFRQKEDRDLFKVTDRG